jgi:hypothetical protein
MAWPAKVAYAVGSLAVAFLAVAMLVGAAPGSFTMAKVYPLFQPFLRTFDLAHDWGFFAPDPGTGHVVRYDVLDERGETHAFRLTEELDRWDPAYFRFTTLYTNASVEDGNYERPTIHYLCRRHAELSPREIRIVVAHQKAVSPEEFRDGVGTMDDLEVFPHDWHACAPEALE